MTLHKTGGLMLLMLAGALPFSLSGCRDSEYSQGTGTANTSGPVSISKMGGDIQVANAPQGADLSTMGGNIHLASSGSYAKAKTMGGNVTIDQATGDVDASTMGGIVNIDNAGGAVHASTMGGNIKARLVGTSASERDVELDSKGGRIELIVPKDFPMEVQITITYTKNSAQNFQVVDSIGLTQETTADWDNTLGTPRKYIRAKGRVGSGLNHVTIKTINGDVILKQE
jgi:DUF4097 and DUF4098 domain-containing protein YvlB